MTSLRKFFEFRVIMTEHFIDGMGGKMAADHDDGRRRRPFLSRVMISPLHFLAAILHVLTQPLGVEPAASLLITGGFFGLALWSAFFYWALLRVCECVLEQFVGLEVDLIRYAGLTLVVVYVVQILILDNEHNKVRGGDAAGPIRPQNFIERAARKFYDAGLDYNPIRCVPWSTDAKLDPKQRYVFACHPHGIHCMPLSQFTTYNSSFDKMFPGIVGNVAGLAALVMFKLPLVREIFIGWGYKPASRKIASRAMEMGQSIVVCTGGEEESMLTIPGRDIVVLKNTKGFVRLALSHGASLVSVFGAGNTDCYKTYGFMMGARMWLQRNAGIALPIFHGRFFTPLPYKVPINCLIGEPIPTPVPKVPGAKPDDKLVDEYHVKYIEQLKALHKKHVKDRVLEIR